MSNKFYKADIIDKYILGHLDEEETKDVIQKIESDPEFADSVRERRNLITGVELQGREVLKNKIRDIHAQAKSQNNSPTRKGPFFGKWIYIILGISTLLFGSYWISQNLGSEDSNIEENNVEIYASYFEPFDISEIKRSGGGDVEGLNQSLNIEKLYADKKYAEVIPLLLDKLSKSTNRSSSDLIGLGVSYLETGKFQDALASFKEILDSNDFGFEDDARWYSSLTYLKKGDIAEAIQSLSPLAKDINADYHREAVSLMKKLE